MPIDKILIPDPARSIGGGKTIADALISDLTNSNIVLEKIGENPTTDELQIAITAEIEKRILLELQTDPKSIGYDGKTPEEIYSLINREIVIKEVRPSRMVVACFPDSPPVSPRTLDDLIGDSVDNNVARKLRIVLEHNADELAGRTDADVIAWLEAPQEIASEIKIPPVSRIFRGIPYSPNEITLAMINEVLK